MNSEIHSPQDSRHYEKVLRMVLWGEPKGKIFDALEANGIAGVEAEDLYQAARIDRVATIRRAYGKKAFLGGVMIVGAVGLFCIFWLGLGLMIRVILLGSAVVSVFGAHKLIDGLIGCAFAHKKEGSVTEDL